MTLSGAFMPGGEEYLAKRGIALVSHLGYSRASELELEEPPTYHSHYDSTV
jgi:hypothetical protein